MTSAAINVVLSPPEIDHLPNRDLTNTIAVVFDVLRATSTMVTALAHGAAGIWPVRTIKEAFALKEKHPAALLGGERLGDLIPGFDLGNSPLEYRENVRGREIITTTTNGTIALRAVEHASSILAGALLNIDAVARRLNSQSTHEILLLCAGTFREPALEDILAAGMLISLLPNREPTDSAQLALALYRQYQSNLQVPLYQSRNGRALLAKNRRLEVEWCARPSIYQLLAGMTPDGSIRVIP